MFYLCNTLKTVIKLLILLVLIPAFVIGQEQKNIDLLDHWHEDTLISNTSLVRYSGCWGFEQNGQEYAIIGSTEGTHFFRLTEKNTLENIDFIEGRYNSSMVVHREFKTYQHYAYSICDEGTSSLQIIDLSYLPDSVVKVADIQDARFGKVHNLFIDTVNALLYACLVTPIVNDIQLSLIPLRVFSLADPLDPQLIWEGPEDIPEVHDCYVRDNIAFLNCGYDGIRVYDFTNAVAPIYLNNLNFYQDQGYNHQGWLSPDGDTYVFADETNGKRIKKCSVGPNYSLQINGLFGTNHDKGTIPHNIMCNDNFAFVAHYNEGLRIYDLRSPIPREIAAFDTYNQNSTFQMNGAWGIYSNYQSGRVIVSDRQNGLFLFHFDQQIFLNKPSEEFSIYPNPVLTDGEFIIRSGADEIDEFQIRMYNGLGEKLIEDSVNSTSFSIYQAFNVPGIYTIEVRFLNYLKEEEVAVFKLVVLN